MIVIQEQWENGYNCGEGTFNVLQDVTSQMFDVKNYEIVSEMDSHDAEDDNDVARWLVKTLLAIRKIEAEDENLHCDWSAEDRWTFNVSLTRKPK